MMDIFEEYHSDEWIELTVAFSNGTAKSWLGAAMNFDCVADKFIHIHNVQYRERSLICIPFACVDYCHTSIIDKPSYAKSLQVYGNV